MRKPETIETLYIDFDAFFANVEKQLDPSAREYPLGVTSLPSENAALITCCYMAKAKGIKRGMRVREARGICPNIIIKSARHDIYVRCHNKILDIVGQYVPITKVWSIDEVECALIGRERTECQDLALRIRQGLSDGIGPYITPSIGLSANQFLAKVAAEMNKPNGLTILPPDALPGPLLNLELTDLPGISSNMKKRLHRSGVFSISDFWNISAKHARAIWGNVEGERMWSQLHGYAISRPETTRRMFGHSRLLSGQWGQADKALDCLRLLTVKAAYRMRREGYTAGALGLNLKTQSETRLSRNATFPACADDFRLFKHMNRLFDEACHSLPPKTRFKSVSVMLYDIVAVGTRSGDLFNENPANPKWLAAIKTMDQLNEKHGKSIIHLGPRAKLPGGYVGGKIAFGRVPDAKDFY